MDLIAIAIENPDQKDYHFILATGEENTPVGYACFGPTPLTRGTYTLYWIAVDPACSGQGIGTLLLQWVEAEIIDWKGHMIVLETSSSPDYAQTRHFYEKNGYSLVESIPDFYQEGEDRVTFLKKLGKSNVLIRSPLIPP